MKKQQYIPLEREQSDEDREKPSWDRVRRVARYERMRRVRGGERGCKR